MKKYCMVTVQGHSLRPIVDTGDVLEFEDWDDVKAADVGRFDLLVFHLGGKSWMKQAVGLPGEIIEVQSDGIRLGDLHVCIPDRRMRMLHGYDGVVIPPSCFLVFGTNFGNDSTQFGTLDISVVKGRHSAELLDPSVREMATGA